MEKETIIIQMPMIKLEPQSCELCGKIDKDVQLHVGGLFLWIHPECGEIADKAIERYRRSLALGEVEYLVEEMNIVLRNEGKEA